MLEKLSNVAADAKQCKRSDASSLFGRLRHAWANVLIFHIRWRFRVSHEEIQ